MRKNVFLYCMTGVLAAVFSFSVSALIHTVQDSPSRPALSVPTTVPAVTTQATTAPTLVQVPTTAKPIPSLPVTEPAVPSTPAPTEPVYGWVTMDNKVYYLHPDNNGIKHTGWLLLDGKRYYMDESGVRQTGWIRTDKGRFYLDSEGVMCTGWIELDGKRHYLQPDGLLGSGWVQTQEGRYYLNSDGCPTVGWLQLPKGKYYMQENGLCVTGWFTLAGKTYYMQEDGLVHLGWLETQNGKVYMDAEGVLTTGWLSLDGQRYFLDPEGLVSVGWQELEGKRYYFTVDGVMLSGWQNIDNKDVYFRADGSLAQGKVEVDGKTCYFTSTGQQIYLVNPWNTVPEGYKVEVIQSYDNYKVSKEIDAALRKMMKDCKAAGYNPKICSGYRTHATQVTLYNNKVNKLIKQGYSRAEAEIEAAKHVAVPGTSEHQLGLAVDIVDRAYQVLDEAQAQRPTQKWLMKNSWKYGFILRYPPEKTEITGIIYEPWHYRYVGEELARELHELDICLEEYLDMLTNDGTSCGGLDKS